MTMVLTFGEPMIEFNQLDGGRTYLQGFGGDTSNVAIAAARMGAQAAVMTALGTDDFGDMLIDLWGRETVDFSAVQRFADAPTAVYFVTHDGEGHCFTYRREGSAASRFSIADIDQSAIERARFLHISGITLAVSESCRAAAFRAIELAKRNRTTVVLDTNLRLNLWPLETARSVIHRAAGMADIVLPGLDDARHLTGLNDAEAIVQTYRSMGATTVALTLGADGVMISSGSQSRRIAPFAVDMVDATGAGDTFDGAFLARLAGGAEPFEAGRYANAAAALSTTGFGAVDPMPRLPEVEMLLRGQTPAT